MTGEHRQQRLRAGCMEFEKLMHPCHAASGRRVWEGEPPPIFNVLRGSSREWFSRNAPGPPMRSRAAESPDSLPAGGRPARADCRLHNPALSEAETPQRSLWLPCGSYPIMRVYVIGEGPRRPMNPACKRALPDARQPRAPSRLDSRAALLREPRGKVQGPLSLAQTIPQRNRTRQGFASPLRALDCSGPPRKDQLDIRERGRTESGFGLRSRWSRPHKRTIVNSDCG